MSQPPPIPQENATHEPWVGSFLSFLVPGAGLYLAGQRKLGLLWFIGLTLLWLTKGILASAPQLPGLYSLAALSLANLVLLSLLLVRSYRRVPKLSVRSWTGWVLLAILTVSSREQVAHQFTRPFGIPVSSMEPTIGRHDRVLVQSSAYWFSQPKRGDVIVFKTDLISHPALPKNQYYMKRVAGLPGEKIQIEEGKLLIDGRPVGSPKQLTGSQFAVEQGLIALADPSGFVIPKDAYFVIGDNATNSFDSRYFGAVPRKSILGKVTKIYWPPSHVCGIQ